MKLFAPPATPSLTRSRWSIAAVASIAAGCTAGDAPDGNSDTDTVVDTGSPSGLATVFVNEVMAANTSVLMDEAGAYPDWVELYNPNDHAVDLSGWWLTDDVTTIFKWIVPDGISIPAAGYLIVFCDSDTAEGDLHASFNLDSAGGEDVGLFGPNVLDNPQVDALEDMQPAVPDVSLARMPDGGATWQIDGGPTPGAAND